MTPINELDTYRRKSIRIAGFVTDVAHMTTKKGARFGKMNLNDYSGSTEIILWENNYVKYGNFLQNNQKIMIQGVYDEHKYRQGFMEFQIQNMMLLDDVRKLMTKRLQFSLPLEKVDADFVAFLEHNIKTNPGNTELIIHISDDSNDRAVRLKTQGVKIVVSDELIKFLTENDFIRYSLDKTA